jgi:hypothetical protein
MFDDRVAPAVESVAGLAPAASTIGPAPHGGDALFVDDRLAASAPPLDQRGRPSGSTAAIALAAAMHSISEADVRFWFG